MTANSSVIIEYNTRIFLTNKDRAVSLGSGNKIILNEYNIIFDDHVITNCH